MVGNPHLGPEDETILIRETTSRRKLYGWHLLVYGRDIDSASQGCGVDRDHCLFLNGQCAYGRWVDPLST